MESAKLSALEFSLTFRNWEGLFSVKEASKSVESSDFAVAQWKWLLSLPRTVLLLGDGGVGKTTFVERHWTGEEQWLDGPGYKSCQIALQTNWGPVKFNVRKVPGQHKLPLIFQRKDFKDVQCGIVTFDFLSHMTCRNVRNWIRKVERICGDIPIVVCGNKVEMKNRKVKDKHITIGKKFEYHETSVKSSYNLERPFLWLARKVHKCDHLQFAAAALHPAEIAQEAEEQREDEDHDDRL
jgi:GTP-binding nuclear protein Ran